MIEKKEHPNIGIRTISVTKGGPKEHHPEEEIQKKKFYLHSTGSGYIYDKRIFWGVIVICLVIMLYIFNQYGWNFKQQFYFKCEGLNACANPMRDRNLHIYNSYTGQNFKNDCTDGWCNQEFLLPGEYGTKPPGGIFKYFKLIVVLLSIFALLLNHAIHNKGKRFSVKLNIPDKWLDKLRKLGKRLGELEDE